MRASSPRDAAGVLALALALALAGGCGGGAISVDTYTCAPPCPAGVRCGASGCEVPSAAALDLGASAGDLASACQPACEGATPRCNDRGQCVACLVDADCPAGAVCRAAGAGALCLPGCGDDSRCGPGERCCAGGCVDPATDPTNCGACGKACAYPRGVPACQAGGCTLGACEPGFGDCNADAADGCETNLRLAPGSCGACGRGCSFAHARAACANGCYLAACDFGWADCNGAAGDGCETSVSDDASNCGGCGAACAGEAHATVGCQAAACRITACSPGFADCDGLLADGCEVATAVDARNCGACGVACGPGLVCKAGDCTCAQCSFSNARSSCVNQQCVMGACNPGFADCNAIAQDGCETAVAADPSNCGACNVVCPNNLPACAAGQCSLLFRSCLELHDLGQVVADGVYTIDPGGGPLSAYCDMTTDGGGWTLVHKNDLGGTGDRTDDGFNVKALADPQVNDVAVLPRATIAAISPASELRITATNGYTIYSKGGMPYYTTDNHLANAYPGGQMKYRWADPYVAQMSPLTPFPQHATLVCPSVNGCQGGDTGHLALQRFCCGAPNAGFWFNGAQRFVAGYYAGSGWVR